MKTRFGRETNRILTGLEHTSICRKSGDCCSPAGRPRLMRWRQREFLGHSPPGYYQPLGDLVLKFPHAGDFTKYQRELDLDNAIARVSFRQGDAVFTREIFSSAPAQVLIVRLTCNKPGRISFTAGLARKEGALSESLGNNGLILRGHG